MSASGRRFGPKAFEQFVRAIIRLMRNSDRGSVISSAVVGELAQNHAHLGGARNDFLRMTTLPDMPSDDWTCVNASAYELNPAIDRH
jgi:hypothetical protein